MRPRWTRHLTGAQIAFCAGTQKAIRRQSTGCRPFLQDTHNSAREAAGAGTTPTTVVKLTALDGSAIRNAPRTLDERVKLMRATSRPDDPRLKQATYLRSTVAPVERANAAERLMRLFRSRRRRQPLGQRAETSLAEDLRRL